jgi:antitoxin component HigA of HigAB toxin-antitoxin module
MSASRYIPPAEAEVNYYRQFAKGATTWLNLNQIASIKLGAIQEDLSAVVPQSNLSAIPAGKRKISATLAGKLGKFFGVSAALFVPH